MFFAVLFIPSVLSLYQLAATYKSTDTTCQNMEYYSATTTSVCTGNVSCVCAAGYGCYSVSCVTTLPGTLSYTFDVYDTSGCPSSGLTSRASYSGGGCIQIEPNLYYKSTCAGGQYCYGGQFSDSNCLNVINSQNAKCATVYAGCYGSNGYYGRISGCGAGSLACFEKETVITYEKQNMTLKSLLEKKHKECVVPHVVDNSGLKITTNCKDALPLRLTTEHLVWTPTGFVRADSLKVGDTLTREIDSVEEKCTIQTIEIEDSKYFGLNCEKSEVLANGFKTSTFGVTHTAPATWMKWASKVIGVSKASWLGDSIVKALNKIGFL